LFVVAVQWTTDQPYAAPLSISTLGADTAAECAQEAATFAVAGPADSAGAVTALTVRVGGVTCVTNATGLVNPVSGAFLAAVEGNITRTQSISLARANQTAVEEAALHQQLRLQRRALAQLQADFVALAKTVAVQQSDPFSAPVSESGISSFFGGFTRGLADGPSDALSSSLGISRTDVDVIIAVTAIVLVLILVLVLACACRR